MQHVHIYTYIHTHTIAEGRDLLFMDPLREYQFPPNYNYILLNNFATEILEVVCISRSGNPFITAEDPAVSEYMYSTYLQCVYMKIRCVQSKPRKQWDRCFGLVGSHQHCLHAHIHVQRQRQHVKSGGGARCS